MTFWFDMDGVLNKYIREDYTGDNPLFLQEGKHYYECLPPNYNALKLLKMLQNNKSFDVFILTLLPNDESIRCEHILDKLLWLKKYAPFIYATQFKPAFGLKSIAAMKIKSRKLTKDDILIDDFNFNLLDWQERGGTSIKYINDVNSPSSWNGYKIYDSSFKDDIDWILSSM